MTKEDLAMVEQLKQVTDITDTGLIQKVVDLLSSFNPMIVQELGQVNPLIIQRLIGSGDLSALRLLGDMDPQVIKTLAMMEVPLVMEMAVLNGMGFILDTLQNMTQADPEVMQAIGDLASDDLTQFANPQDLLNEIVNKKSGGGEFRGSDKFTGRGFPRGNFRARFFRGAARGFSRGNFRARGPYRGGFRGYRGGFKSDFRGNNRGNYNSGYLESHESSSENVHGGFKRDHQRDQDDEPPVKKIK